MSSSFPRCGWLFVVIALGCSVPLLRLSGHSGSASYEGLRLTQERWLVVLDTTNTTLFVDEQKLGENIPALAAGIKYAIWNMSLNPREKIEKEFNDILMTCGRQAVPQELLVRGQDGKPLSALLVRWLTGHVTPQAFAAEVSRYASYDIFMRIAESIVDPHMIANHTNALAEAVRFVSRCCQLLGASSVCLAGNWDRYSLPLLQQRPATKQLFAQIPTQLQFVSGVTQCALPCDASRLFAHIAAQTHVPLDHIIFVSAVGRHIAAAQKAGVRVIHVLQRRFDEAYNALVQLVHVAQ